MADISNVRYEEIKEITENLEGLSCKLRSCFTFNSILTLIQRAF